MQGRIQNIASILYDQGVRNVIISPGSRNAPLTIAFVNHGEFNIEMICDERSAAFVGLGQSIAAKLPTLLICTSGTAAINYYPAICEAFYQEVPLIVLTADRPPELIDQGDGQSIRQSNVFQNHILSSFDLLPDYDSDASYQHLIRVTNEAFLTASNPYKRGPVHINIPFREPFYPQSKASSVPYRVLKKYDSTTKKLSKQVKNQLEKELRGFKKIWVFKGQELEDTPLTKHAQRIAIAKDVMGSPCTTDHFLTMHDFLFSKTENFPDLVITLGKNILSKAMKTAFRNHPIAHWHVGTQENVPDLFGQLTKHISCSPKYFFEGLEFGDSSYRNQLYSQELALRAVSERYLSSQELTEFKAMDWILETMPKTANLHVSNSMPIRYLNHLQYKLKRNAVYCNRGTSGIDGSLSTAIGIASLSPKENYLFTGDLSFFYDRNSLWNNIDKSRVKIILLNNSGGGIFDIIKGPTNQSIDKTYFTTPQPLTARNTAKDFEMDYYAVAHPKDLKAVLKDFHTLPCQNGKILEVITSMDLNTEFYKNYIKTLNA